MKRSFLKLYLKLRSSTSQSPIRRQKFYQSLEQREAGIKNHQPGTREMKRKKKGDTGKSQSHNCRSSQQPRTGTRKESLVLLTLRSSEEGPCGAGTRTSKERAAAG